MNPRAPRKHFALRPVFAGSVMGFATVLALHGAPVITRLTPPSSLFSYGDAAPPHIARFLPGQRFDLQASIRPDEGQTITSAAFFIDGVEIAGTVSLTPATAAGVAPGMVVATLRATSRTTTGVRKLTVRATQDNGAEATASGSFEVVALAAASGVKARNIIVMIGDGFGIAHRTAARVMLRGVSQGKALAPLAMDTLPSTALVQTASLNSLITDSSSGASAFSTGNKAANGQVGVFPDDTADIFDNPRVELIGEYLARTQGKWLGIVTTADVADATPAAFAAHAQEREAGAGIVDAYLDEAVPLSNLRVLLGGGRGWFLPDTTPGSYRTAAHDSELPAELAAGWGVARGSVDPGRDVLGEFRQADFAYAATRAQLAAMPATTSRLLGLFHFSHLNAAMDRVLKRRGRSTVVDDYGFPDQPMLDEMTDAALAVLKQNAAGFVLLVEGALIDKQSHLMDTERLLHEVIEFDRAVARAKAFAELVPDTLVMVTGDHETGGFNLIGGSRVTQADLAARVAAGGGVARLRDEVVVTGTPVSFPNYAILADGYPETADVNRRMVIGYAANADRYENWQTSAKPTEAPNPPGYPGTPIERNVAGGFLITGQIPGVVAAHTGSDIPLSAMGAGATFFTGVIDNTDIFFTLLRAAVAGGGAAAAGIVAPAVTVMPVNAGLSTAGERLVNISSRALVGVGGEPMMSGFVLAGTKPRTLLIRGVGPALLGQGVANALRDPLIRVFNAAGVQIAANDDWPTGDNASAAGEAAAAVGAFPLPAGSRDAALLIELPIGAYTVQLSAADAGSGVGLIEIYEVR